MEATLTLDTSQAIDMEGMFVYAQGFNQALAFHNRKVTNMSGMFFSAIKFNSGKAAGVGQSKSFERLGY